MAFNPQAIDKKWSKIWEEKETYKVSNKTDKPKYYVLDMFPYPSGSGLHVGHPLGYVASDIYARYKRLKGYNVLHPMGFDAFGLPAEQYAIETGKHPIETTEENIKTYKKQLKNIGLSFDWSREVITSEPTYYKWTQWIFTKMFHYCYCTADDKAQPITFLIEQFEKDGNTKTAAYTDYKEKFSAEEWKSFSSKEQDDILMHYRLAYKKVGYVNWCEALGTVLANDEVVNGVSERGGYPVVQKPMMQWSLRITAYAERLLKSIKDLEWSESLKAQQENWIGKSEGAIVHFEIAPIPNPSPKGEGNKTSSWMTANPSTYKNIQEFAKEMRKNPTKAEDILWQELRNKNLYAKFRRQHVIDNFIPDFVCLDLKLIIEVDGEIHQIPENIEKDLGRTNELEELGYTILRFTNNEVEENLPKVLIEINNKIVELEASPSQEERGQGGEATIKVFTTRPDTIFGVTFMVLAPEHPLVDSITTVEQKTEVEIYKEKAKSKSNVDRQASKEVSGAFTGAFAIHPLTGNKIPIWISEYVLIDYGTGAIMAVPSDDDRDEAFAKYIGIPEKDINKICDKTDYPNATKADKIGKIINSEFLNGLEVKDAIKLAIEKIEEKGIGQRQINYKLRDANFSRQRYWGEPFPVYYDENGVAHTLPKDKLPLELPPMDDIKPENGKAPLSKVKDWQYKSMPLDVDTMPGNAGSSWYFLRYMDPNNPNEFCSKEALDYWQDVDLYVGGTEHAVGHLMYARFWHKFLYDLGYVPTQEPFKKLINQGMIQGESAFGYTVDFSIQQGIDSLLKDIKIKDTFVVQKEMVKSFDEENQSLKDYPELREFILKNYDVETLDDFKIKGFNPLRININFIKNDELDVEAIRSDAKYSNYIFIKNSRGSFKCHREVEKMSKSKYNVVNPDDVIAEYGADCFRMFEMFLGPIENHKPWQTKGIDGVGRFLRKLWHLFYDEDNNSLITQEKPTEKELKILHTCIKKVNEDVERFSFNTCVSAFMICVNELTDLKCHKQAILEEVLKLLSPFAPHISEELWSKLGHTNSVVKDVTYPMHEEKYLTESVIEYPVSINGKMRVKIQLAADATQDQAKEIVLADETVQKWLEGKEPKKFIFVPKRIVNIVV